MTKSGGVKPLTVQQTIRMAGDYKSRRLTLIGVANQEQVEVQEAEVSFPWA
jgi:hypothetical protein